MSIEAANDEFDHVLNEFEKNREGSDSQRTYTLLESGEYCNSCFKNPKMKELGIEKISFQVYQLAEEKLFNMEFNVAANNGEMVYLHFPDRTIFATDSVKIFEEVKKMATNRGAVGLENLANQAAILASRPRPFPPNTDSPYLRCMDKCDDIEFEPFKLLCYAACTIWADKTPGS